MELRDWFDEILEDSNNDDIWIKSKNFTSKEIVKYIVKELDQEIEIFCANIWEDSGIVCFLNHIKESYSSLNQKDKNNFWKKIKPVMKISCVGGDVFAPSILPTGALLIRNHHRVIGLVDQVQGWFPAPREDFQNELKRYWDLMKERDLDGSAFVIHHDDDGIKIFEDEIPDILSPVGQTLVFLPHSWFEQEEIQKTTFVNDPFARDAAESSRSGHAVYRVFDQEVFVYSTCRYSDDLDDVLENYASKLEDEPIDHDYIVGSNEKTIKKWLELEIPNKVDYIQEILESSNIHGVLKNDVLIEIYKEIESRIFPLISEVQPIFCSDQYVPATHSGVGNSFLELQREAGERWAILTLSVSPEMIEESNQISSGHILEKVLEYIEDSSFETISTMLIRNPEDDSKVISFPVDSEEADKYFQSKEEAFSSSVQEATENDEDADQDDIISDVLDDMEIKFSLAFPMDFFDVPQIQKELLQISGDYDLNINLDIPELGISHGFWSGTLDTGNLNMFAPVPDDDFS